MVEKCRREGNNVMVGYTGGAAKLQARAAEGLQSRPFKWDRADDPLPPKVPCNWIPAARFLELMTAKFPDLMDSLRN